MVAAESAALRALVVAATNAAAALPAAALAPAWPAEWDSSKVALVKAFGGALFESQATGGDPVYLAGSIPVARKNGLSCDPGPALHARTGGPAVARPSPRRPGRGAGRGSRSGPSGGDVDAANRRRDRGQTYRQ